jgi:RNA polymerase sigma factor (sigma-70 family)
MDEATRREREADGGRGPATFLEPNAPGAFEATPARSVGSPLDDWSIEGYRNGEMAVLARLYTLYSGVVRQQVRSMAWAHGRDDLTDRGELADLVQETFLRAFSSVARSRYDGRRPFRPYVAAIARNCFVDRVRERAREVLRDPDGLRELVEHDLDTEDGAEPADHRTFAASYLETLPPLLKGVYHQRFVLDRGQTEAAGALGITRAVLRFAEKKIVDGLKRAIARQDRA